METYREKSAYRKLGVPALLSAVRRRALYLLIPAVVFAGAAWRYAQRRPQNFKARVEIAAEPVVPTNYLSDRPAVTPVVNVTEQLRAIRDVLLNPMMLRSVIDEVGYGRTREGQQAVDEMRTKIQI